MKKFRTILVALAFGSVISLAFAEEPLAPPPGGGRPGMHGPRDCSKAPDAEKKARCEERQAAMKAAMEKCKDLKEDAHRKCMMDAMPPRPEGAPPKKPQ